MLNPPFPKIIHVTASPAYRLLLTFDNGECRVFKMDGLVKHPEYGPMLKPVFLQAAVNEHGEVYWPDCNLDIAPGMLYSGAQPV